MFSSKITTRCLIGVVVGEPEPQSPRSTLPPALGCAGVVAPPLPQLGWASANVRPSAAAAAVPATATGRRPACLMVRGSLATSSPPHGAELGRLSQDVRSKSLLWCTDLTSTPKWRAGELRGSS